MSNSKARERVKWLGAFLLLALAYSSRLARTASLNSFVKHKTPEQEAAEAAAAQAGVAEAKKLRLKTEAEAQAKLKIPKVALLFLTRGDMPHEAAWAAWLSAARGLVPLDVLPPGVCSLNKTLQQPKGPVRDRKETRRLRRSIFVEQALFSIYLHPSPEFNGYSKNSVFYGRSIRLRVKVTWGTHSEVEAMRLLLRAALANPLNQHFVYLCETTIPLYPPTVIYSQLIKEGKSRISACPHADPENPAHSINRWSERMLPLVPRGMWRKSGQWVTLLRKHADIVSEDNAVASEFEEHCEMEANEHYFGVLLAVKRLENETTCTSNAMSCVWPWETGEMSHPVTFQADQITEDLVLERRQDAPKHAKRQKRCKDQDAIRMAEESFVEVASDWRVGCHWRAKTQYNHSTLSGHECALFARKMSPFAKLQVEDVVTSCDKRIKIAPRPSCSKGFGSGWLF